mgnify:CR=1 FL=1
MCWGGVGTVLRGLVLQQNEPMLFLALGEKTNLLILATVANQQDMHNCVQQAAWHQAARHRQGRAPPSEKGMLPVVFPVKQTALLFFMRPPLG